MNTIDRDDLRDAAEGHLRFGGGGDDLAQGVLTLLDALDHAEQRIQAVRELVTAADRNQNAFIETGHLRAALHSIAPVEGSGS